MKKEELFQEMEKHLMEDEKPSLYFKTCSENSLFKEEPFLMLKRLQDTKQSPKYHPEGSVWNHTMMVVDEAAKVKNESSDSKAFMWAALLHDIGKPDTTKTRKGRIISYDHDVLGEQLTIQFLQEFTADKELIGKIAALVRWHMQILYVLKDLPYKNITAMKKQVDSKDITLLTWCDRMGRGNAVAETERKDIDAFYEKVKG